MNKENLKPLYLTLAATTAVGVPFIPHATWDGASMMIGLCLTVAFISRERIQDERVEHLKLKAVNTALVAGTLAICLQAWYAKVHRADQAVIRYLSAFDLLIITMLVALGLFHYWRWQDGRAA